MPDIVVPSGPAVPYVGFNADRWYAHRFYYGNVVNSSGAVGVAAVLTANLVLPPSTLLLDIIVTSDALWNQGTSAALVVGDADDADGFILSTDLKATDLLQYESISIGANTALAGGKIGAYMANSQWCKGSGTYGQRSPLKRTLTATVTTIGTAATTGDVTVFWRVLLPLSGAEPVTTATVVIS